MFIFVLKATCFFIKKQVGHLKEREITLSGEAKALREDLGKRNSLLVQLKEEKIRGTAQGPGGGVSLYKEKEELKSTIKQLEEKLRIANQAEKPLEDNNLSSSRGN